MNQIYVILTNLCSNLNIQEKYSEQTKSLLNIMYNNDDLDSKLLNYYVFVALWITLKKDSNCVFKFGIYCDFFDFILSKGVSKPGFVFVA